MRKRPRYETREDRKEQERTARDIERCWGSSVHCTDPNHPADFEISHDGRFRAWGEHKRRFVNRDAYATLILSESKAKKLIAMSERDGVMALLFVRYNDGLVWGKLRPEHLERTRPAGREDRGDEMDIEPCIDFPVSALKAMSPGN